MHLDKIFMLRDTHIGGLSISAVTTIGDYVQWFRQYGLENKLDEQRPTLHTRSANMIRQRLIEDLKTGAVIPPIVIGFTTDADLQYVSEDNAAQLIAHHLNSATVIDENFTEPDMKMIAKGVLASTEIARELKALFK